MVAVHWPYLTEPKTGSSISLYVVCIMLYRKHMLALVSRALKVYKQHVPRIIQLLRFESYFHWFFFETDPFCIYMSMIE